MNNTLNHTALEPIPAIADSEALVAIVGIMNVLSLLLGLYILSTLIKVNVRRARIDYHYRLRLSASLVTVTALILNIVYHFINAFKGFILMAQFIYGIILCLIVLLVALVFLLTIDRYVRVCMILQQSLSFKLLVGLRYWSATAAIILSLIYLIRTWWNPFRGENVEDWVRANFGADGLGILNIFKSVVEVSFLVTTAFTEYLLTYRMIRYSVRSSLNFNDSHNQIDQPVNLRQQMLLKEKQKFILWMILWCSIIILADGFNAGIHLYFANFWQSVRMERLFSLQAEWQIAQQKEERLFLQLQTISVSWISARVFCTFKLLDIFLNKIKHIKQDGKKAKQAAPQTTEMTTMESKTTIEFDPSGVESNSGKFENNHGKLYSLDFKDSLSN